MDRILHRSDLKAPLCFSDLFGREAPVEVEIGAGKGRYLREIASLFPERDFLGIERSAKWIDHTAVRLAKADVKNVRLLTITAEEFLGRYVANESVHRYHVLFPDPWPKRKHHKRRLFSPDFLTQLARTLVRDGEVQMATDHVAYRDAIVQSFAELSTPYFRLETASQPGPCMSNFQAKYEREGRPLFFLQAHRNPKIAVEMKRGFLGVETGRRSDYRDRPSRAAS